ncbi:MAG: LemA family protein [Deltaproteobacteria bacterium]|nr:LemA family protein [Deltaproteobacteria bacterium]
MKTKWIVAGFIVFMLLLGGGSCVSKYNELVTLNESVTGSWAQVENVLQRRNDLIPNLVETVKGYAAHEKEVFEKVAEARAKLGGAKTINEKVQASQEMDGALSRLLLIVERYPDLKANQNFLALQDELAGTENRIAVERQRYNGVVQAFNIEVQRFPGAIVARVMGFAKKEAYFKAAEGAKEAPKVQF